MTKSVKITISGKVQGVWFRASAQSEANRLGVNGIVKNMPDGCVYAEAEGSETAVDAFLQWCEHGSPNAVVESVECVPQPMQHYERFEIVRR